MQKMGILNWFVLPDVDSQRSFSGIYNKDFPSFHIFQIIHLGLFSIEFLNSYLDLIFFFFFCCWVWNWEELEQQQGWIWGWGRGWDVVSQCLGTHSTNQLKIPNFFPHSQTSTRTRWVWEWSPWGLNSLFEYIKSQGAEWSLPWLIFNLHCFTVILFLYIM